MRTIIVTGSVGTGKTQVAKKLSKKLKARYINVGKLVTSYKLAEGYDTLRKCKIVDVNKLNKVLISLIKKSKKDMVIDSHLAHFLDKRYVDLCVVAKCNLAELKRRLQKRRYSQAKIRENLDVEIFDVCLMEAMALGHTIKVIDTSTKKGLKSLDALLLN